MASYTMTRWMTTLTLVALVATLARPAHLVIAQDTFPARHAGAAAGSVFLPAVFYSPQPLPVAAVSAALDAIKDQ